MPAHPPHLPEHGSVLAEVRKVRRAGVVRLRELHVPELARIARKFTASAATTPAPAPVTAPAPVDAGGGVERLLRAAVSRVGGGTLQTAAEYSLGLAQGTRDWPAADRRRRAAQVYGVSVERFRKHHELMVLGQIAEQLLGLAGQHGEAGRDAGGGGAAGSAAQGTPLAVAAVHRTHRTVRARGAATLRVHVHSVDLLRDVDVVVSPTNTYFALPATYKSSVSATLRRAGADLDPTGGLVTDRVHDELRGWAARHGTPGRAVLPGTVAPTSAGALAAQGIRRIYHLAVAQPRPGTNDYDVQPADVTRGVARVFALLAEESARFDPPLRSVCLPLVGAGRGGLTPLESFGALWPAVEAELARGAEQGARGGAGPWEVHLVVRAHARADLIERLLADDGGTG
ncbi:hypothetical protein [Streptomyces ficellus]|uniref:Macro domain-containing protein n=1 Tax=Streptomyces ficellus TaxID=1977088 RepID=A0A6I6F1C5_9ACTN|nr:hypothetical protein [Streptomyces ficellus]QGV77440.1 hypothetical protein EIZ62_03620 [Streptomyces ficellus]